MTTPDDEAATFAATLFGKRRQPKDEREMARIIFGGGDRYTDADPEPATEADTRDGNHVPREGQPIAPPTDHSFEAAVRRLFDTNH